MPQLHDGKSSVIKARLTRELPDPSSANRAGDAMSSKISEIGKLPTGWDGRDAPAPTPPHSPPPIAWLMPSATSNRTPTASPRPSMAESCSR